MREGATIADVIEGRAHWCVVTGDCLAVLPTIPAGSVGAVVTDPPYSVSVAGAVHVGTKGDRRNLDFFEGDDDWAAMTSRVVEAAQLTLPAMDEGASAYWWCGHRQFGDLVRTFEDAGLSTRFLVWSKACPAPPPPWSGWPSGAELCVYAYPKGRRWEYGPDAVPRSNVIVADGYRHGQPGKVAHPTQKPIDTMQIPMLSCTVEGSVILDPFCGSGTTGVAAIKTGRRFIGIEICDEYAQIARRRIREAEPVLFTRAAERQAQIFEEPP